jgi:hypothetical protein
MRGCIVGRHEALMHLLQFCRGGGVGKLVVVEAPLNIEVRLEEIFIAFSVGAHQGIGRNRQPLQHGFDLVGREGAAGVGNQVLRGTIAQTGSIQHHERYPTGLSRGDGPGQHRAGVVLQDNDAPPPDPVQGKVHHPAINKPILVWRRGFIRMGLGRLLRAFGPLRWGDVIIDVPIEGHHPSHRPHGNRVIGQQAPDAERASIWMGFLEMINRHHKGEPHFPWRPGTTRTIHEPGQVFRLETVKPPIDGRT